MPPWDPTISNSLHDFKRCNLSHADQQLGMQFVDSHQFAQPSLFPLDLWGADQLFPVIDHPYPGIARAMIGPVGIGGKSVPPGYPLHCFAASSDGRRITCLRIYMGQILSADRMHFVWERVRQGFNSSVGSNYASSDLVATDFWIPTQKNYGFLTAIHSILSLVRQLEIPVESPTIETDWLRVETDIQTAIKLQLQSGIGSVLAAKSDIFEMCLTLCNQRMQLSPVVVTHLLSKAQPHGQLAMAYALQALRTESLGLLNFAAYPEECVEARHVFDAITLGKSLPKTLEKLGISKAVHRKTIRPSGKDSEKRSATNLSLFNMNISGSEWISLMRAIALYAPQSSAEILILRELLAVAHSVPDLNSATKSDWISWSLQKGYKNCTRRATTIGDIVNTNRKTVGSLVKARVDINQFLSEVLTVAKRLESVGMVSQEQFLLRLRSLSIEIASTISGKSMAQLLAPVFRAHPGLPKALPEVMYGYTIIPLDDYGQLVSHALNLEICLQHTLTLIDYLREGCAFYAVTAADQVVATLALRLKVGDEGELAVDVYEVKGANNSVPNTKILHLGYGVALAWEKVQLEIDWSHYSDCVSAALMNQDSVLIGGIDR
jgi:hypothetical protein